MQVSLEVIDEQERKLTISVPSAEFEQRIEERLREEASGIELKGFRPGKVPFKEVRRRFGTAIREEVAHDMVQEYATKALEREEPDPVDVPELAIENMEAGNDLKFTIIVRTLSDIELGDFSKIVLREPHVEITDEDIEDQIQKLRRYMADHQEVQRPAREGDRVTVGFAVALDGGRVGSGFDEELSITLDRQAEEDEEGYSVAEFSEILIGAEPGEVRPAPSLDVGDPAGAEQRARAGVRCDVTVKKIEQAHLPELDADFLSSVGVEDGGMEELRTTMREALTHQVRALAEDQMKMQLFEGVVAMHRIPLPDALLHEATVQEKERILDEMWEEKHGISLDLMDSSFDAEYEQHIKQAEHWPDEEVRAQAEKNIIFDMVLKAVIKANSITPDETLLRERIDEIAQESEDPERVVKLIHGDEEMLRNLEKQVQDDQAIERILESVTIEPVTCSFQEATSSTFITPDQVQAWSKA